jgi:DMSO/TMAO reductase YedYZ molybdopterin-dependent catalytic subunit
MPNGTGFKLKPLLHRAGVKPNAIYAAMRAADGYYTGVPLAELMRDENWLAYRMNGEPLPPEHGFPLRIFIPGKYGMKQPKWLTEIELVGTPFIGYWEARAAGATRPGVRSTQASSIHASPPGF